ncbi:CapA family protein [Adlercreutzia sp. R21]|uniref:CapA family protein n=1 Tax=Adlercreutzia wanghongyangiae TaxID=3111451 RepID=UPI002DBE9047|nr:CapA family protein [Adlercreutzia sp. R21]MEC4185242.1 CapA family protein [Adlercreutzia sp. R21]
MTDQHRPARRPANRPNARRVHDSARADGRHSHEHRTPSRTGHHPRPRPAGPEGASRRVTRRGAASAPARTPRGTSRHQEHNAPSPSRSLVVIFAAIVLIAGAGGLWALAHNGSASSPDGTASAPAASTPDDTLAANDATAPAEPVTVTITFAGDCTLGTEERFDQSTAFPAVYEKKGPDYFFANVKDTLSADDLTVANCECVLTQANTREDKEYAYKGDPAYASLFAEASIDAVSVSNNHNRDYGAESYDDTIVALAEAGVDAFGDDLIVYEEVKGVKVALIGAKMISAPLEEMQPKVEAAIHEAQNAGAQIIVVFMHWGIMREYTPTDDMITLAHAAIDAGATTVVGAHQHVVQGYEKYHGRYIAYGLGNFCYGGSLTLRDPDCYLFRQTFTVSENGVEADDAVEIIPCLISSSSDRNNYQPTLAEGSDKERIEQKIADSSANIAARSEESAH